MTKNVTRPQMFSLPNNIYSSPPNKTLIRNERCSNPSFVVYGRLIRLPRRVGVRNLNQRSKSQSWRIPRCPPRILN